MASATGTRTQIVRAPEGRRNCTAIPPPRPGRECEGHWFRWLTPPANLRCPSGTRNIPAPVSITPGFTAAGARSCKKFRGSLRSSVKESGSKSQETSRQQSKRSCFDRTTTAIETEHPRGPAAHPAKKWRQFFRRIGLPHLSFHCTRVTVATKFARSGVPISQAKAYIGHASDTVHAIYQRLTPADVAHLGAVLSNPTAGTQGAPATTPKPTRQSKRRRASETLPTSSV